MERVVITGLGAITPIGNTVEEFWKNLVNGVSGIGFITSFDTSNLPVRIGAEVKDFHPEEYMDFKMIKRSSRSTQFAVAAALQALKDAGLEITEDNATRVGVVLNTGGGGIAGVYQETLNFVKRGPRFVNPLFIPIIMPNAPSCVVSIVTGAKGPVITSTLACASGNHAFLEALHIIRRGEADVVIAGGTESGNVPITFAALSRMGALASFNDEPCKACRPFDKNRCGFVYGEGSAVMIVEREEHARKRGARIYAEVVGGAVTADAYHITAPDPDGDGAARAMRLALENSGMRPEDIDVIFAHGTGTPLNDVSETKAIKKVFGEHAYRLVVTATKSMLGHLLGAAGAVSSLAAVLSIRDGIVPPTINLEEPDPECDLDYVPNVARKMKVRTAMVNGFGFGGQNVATIFRKYE
ncbi:MAG: beta-ketoacyl-[acyl-carrier-protein] synthase II [Chloroflexi bacterium]|nr:MAG: beta-ketoacyl-[acyl-carrier-protein] synthase II [Chloroflexota bacterium]